MIAIDDILIPSIASFKGTCPLHLLQGKLLLLHKAVLKVQQLLVCAVLRMMCFEHALSAESFLIQPTCRMYYVMLLCRLK